MNGSVLSQAECTQQSVLHEYQDNNHWTLGTARRACAIFKHFSGFEFFLLPAESTPAPGCTVHTESKHDILFNDDTFRHCPPAASQPKH
jgi:hypothetical protein